MSEEDGETKSGREVGEEEDHMDEGGSPGNGIKVFLRIRPTRRPSGYLCLDDENPGAVKFEIPNEVASTHVNNNKTSYGFRFNGIVGPDANQEDVFDRVAKDAALSAMEGFNATVFAYGQTGSGKTFTMTGGAERYIDRGIIPRALSLLFSEIERRTDVQITAHISYLEIYNDNGYDLLNPSHEYQGIEDLPKVNLMEDDEGNIHLKNLSMHLASSEEDALNLLFLGDTNRAISETPMNLASSRSHCIFTISLEMRQAGSDVIRRSKLHLVDLAGSERVHKTNSGGTLLREAKHINSSLHYLEMVIVALHERHVKGRIHIPYRNSMMTSVLRDSLGGNCKTSMIATISAEKANTEETISTCRFAQRVALVQNDALVNEEIDPSMLIKKLKSEVVALREEVAFLKGERGDEAEGDRIDNLERQRLQNVICEWVQSVPSESKTDEGYLNQLQPGPLTFARIHACFEILRELVINRSPGEDTSSEDVSQLKRKVQKRDEQIAVLSQMLQKATGKVLEDCLAEPHQMTRDETEKTTRRRQNASIPLPPPEIIHDKDRALEFYKKHYPSTKAINENKRLLKEKYALAKQTGETVNSSRSEINRLKSAIERLRAQNAMHQLVHGEDFDRRIQDSTPEETQLTSEMESQKGTYSEQFQRLKELKKEIEHIQSLLRKNRDVLQRDFEQWFELVQMRHDERDEDEEKKNHRIPEKDAAPKPANVKLTRNQEADEDIRAFYQAREQLLKRRNSIEKK